MTGRQTRSSIYAVLTILIALYPWGFIGPMLFLLLMDAIDG